MAKKMRPERTALVRAVRNLCSPTHRKERDGWGARSFVAALSPLPRSIQKPQIGMKRSRVELRRAMRPERMPNAAQREVVCGSAAGTSSGFSWLSPMARTRRAIAMSFEKRKVVMAMSQIQRTAYCMAAGWRAQSQPDQRAIFLARVGPRVWKQRTAISGRVTGGV